MYMAFIKIQSVKVVGARSVRMRHRFPTTKRGCQAADEHKKETFINYHKEASASDIRRPSTSNECEEAFICSTWRDLPGRC
jgi:hypothetical protein